MFPTPIIIFNRPIILCYNKTVLTDIPDRGEEMTTRQTITITFENAIRQADHIKDCSNSMKTEKQRINNLISELKSGWNSDSTGKYLEKCRILADRIDKTSANLDRVSSTIKAAATNYYRAEMQALDIIATKKL